MQQALQHHQGLHACRLASHAACSTSAAAACAAAAAPPAIMRHRGRRRVMVPRAAAPSAPNGSGEQGEWWSRLNRHNPVGPSGAPPEPPPSRGLGYDLMGEAGYRQYVEGRKAERQRVWDVMRQTAQERYERGELPGWFDPQWLVQEEAPVNALMREMGDELYMEQQQQQQPDTAGGDDGGSGGSAGGRGGWRGAGGGGWWREDDPYWMLRDWGDHPMRWWTLGFAGLFTVGGLAAYATSGSTESLFWGWGAGAWLALCSLAMSDMTSSVQPHGELGVKGAWAACAAMALKDGLAGWAHRPAAATYRSAHELLEGERQPAPWVFLVPKLPALHLGGCGLAAAAMCAAYMATGMAGLEWHALPDNPGAVYKSSDVVYKHYVWSKWGYSANSMRM